MNIIESPNYRSAFVQYLRSGVPVGMSLKAAEAHTTSHYVWRTRGDNKVRKAHAINNGRIFSWDNPPVTGHPGESYGCRCAAEPYVRGETEFAYQTLTTGMQDSDDSWELPDFVAHYYFGSGVPVDLGEAGIFEKILSYYFYTLGKYDAVNAQIIEAARREKSGYFEYEFRGAPSFKPLIFAIGGATVSGKFSGTVTHDDAMMFISGDVAYRFYDQFTDAFSEREDAIGTSNPAAASPDLLAETEYGGSYYDVVGDWQANFRADAKKDRLESRYRQD